MLRKIEQAEQKWGGSHSAIDNWLNARKQLLVEYCRLAGLPPFEGDKQALPTKNSIEAFCELLMDYVSAGHFEFYDQIVNGSAANGCALADEIYPQISGTTDEALSFNDHYAEIEEEQDLTGFDRHLSQLGQAMEERFELEDKLINNLYQRHL
ncbi:sigma D regulator [Bowmanella dokdonensis]|uniref:Sigma D regulator n=1 Tax=Bowmanella dokdonensis TaxID=751969 RepID=A0A939DJZ0_9ALTE|nr:sigma D regulator [Bowmanella dokdonensis]MBN7823722.1 sigma D regulator [Bowmanella dokdonensis]